MSLLKETKTKEKREKCFNEQSATQVCFIYLVQNVMICLSDKLIFKRKQTENCRKIVCNLGSALTFEPMKFL